MFLIIGKWNRIVISAIQSLYNDWSVYLKMIRIIIMVRLSSQSDEQQIACTWQATFAILFVDLSSLAFITHSFIWHNLSASHFISIINILADKSCRTYSTSSFIEAHLLSIVWAVRMTLSLSLLLPVYLRSWTADNRWMGCYQLKSAPTLNLRLILLRAESKNSYWLVFGRGHAFSKTKNPFKIYDQSIY